MHKFCMIAWSLFLLSGCASFGQMKDGLNTLKGKKVRVAIDVLGKPSDKQINANKTIYTWSLNQRGSIVIPHILPGNGNHTYYQVIPVNHHCSIKLIADTNNEIIKWGYNGDIGGCANYINRLKAYRENTHRRLNILVPQGSSE
ncbi:hypothetical protein [Celerinatantimonas diazotrophica]|uniref:Lipoprotein n=1 Tax=Celerinatantimonas diazotrophica TaxID=412034 RepID=A0A4R1K4U8_9GAMM|nr:hypothetical protein [Celerinatantimonas diazotrophica]TCK58763.1 hypothetical protein EV690_0909 [Celerinatantimonas diazotrophica]CAG9297394.1 hypothetical protein CEDIAZO_02575 [Celerinatantimonas diazotrophica]